MCVCFVWMVWYVVRVHGVCLLVMPMFRKMPTFAPRHEMLVSLEPPPLLPRHACFFEVFVIHTTKKCEGPFEQQTSRLKLALVGSLCWPFWAVVGLFLDRTLLHYKHMRHRHMVTIYKTSQGEGGEQDASCSHSICVSMELLRQSSRDCTRRVGRILWHWPRVLVWRRPGSAHDFVTGVVGTWSRLRVTWRCN